METGGASNPNLDAKEAEAMEAKAKEARAREASKTDGDNPYSPSDSLSNDETAAEEAMDWENSLPSVKNLFRPPPIPKEGGARLDSLKLNVDQALQIKPVEPESRSAADREVVPGPEAAEAAEAAVAKLPSEPQAGTSQAAKPNTESISSSAASKDTSSGDASASATPAQPLASTTPQVPTAPLTERVGNFLAKAKDKMIQDVKARMGKDMLVYETIAAHNRLASNAKNLLGTNRIQTPALPGFLELGDGRVMSGGLQLDMANKRIVCTSFNQDWKCFRCAAHTEPALKMRGAADSSSECQAIVAADQFFPACLPVDSQAGCLKIIMVESGTLHTICEEIFKQIGNRRLPPGSVILIFSATHLLNLGLTQYTADLIAVINKIQSRYGKETNVQPLPPVLLPGTTVEPLIRSLLELMMWSDEYFAGDTYLETTSLMTRCIILELGEGEQQIPTIQRYALPEKNVSDGKEWKRVWASGGKDCRALPCTVKPLTASMERKFATCLIDELRGKFALDLDRNPSLDKTLGQQVRPKRKVDVLIVGSGNMPASLATVLRSRAKTVDVMASSWWTISRASVERSAAQIRKIIAEEDPDLVVLQILDNSCFYARSEDGSRQLPRNGVDGVFHMEGDVQVCGRETQYEHFHNIRPILDSVGKKKTLLMSPLPRYITAPCCNNPRHTTNRSDHLFKENMDIQLDSLRRNLRDHVFSLNKRNIKILDPNMDLRGLQPEETWGTDPINITDLAANKVVDGMILVANNFGDISNNWRESGRGRGRGNRGGPSRARFDDLNNRSGGRPQGPERSHGGRGHRGGHREHRARPY
jgi:hypothetical protein